MSGMKSKVFGTLTIILLIAVFHCAKIFAHGEEVHNAIPTTGVAKDSDLDGISDVSEVTNYNTDPTKADTDGDHVLDAQEIFDKTDPKDPNSNLLDSSANNSKTLVNTELPIIWMVGRISGIAAFVMFTFVLCAGLMMTSKLLLKFPIFSAPDALETHSFNASFIGLSLLAVHIVSLMNDNTLKLNIPEVLIPFYFQSTVKSAIGYDISFGLALGIIAMYLALILVITSQLRNKVIPAKIWRMIHYSSFIFYLTFIAHGFSTGSDSGELWMQVLYVCSLVLVVGLLLLRIFGKKYFLPVRKKSTPNAPQNSAPVVEHEAEKVSQIAAAPAPTTQRNFPTPKKHIAKLISKSQQTARVVEVKVQLEGDEMPFVAGQFISLCVAPKTFRSYSISSTANNSKGFSMLIENKHVGVGSNFINALSIGDKMELVGPSGRFVLPENLNKNVTFIATGTGVAPILSMLQQLIDTKFDKEVRLYFGVYGAQDLLKKDFLDYCEKNLKSFKYYLCYQNDLTDEDKKDPHVFQGLVTERIDLSNPTNTIFGICGHPNMCTDMKALLLSKNITEENIFHEKFSVAVQPAKK